MFWTTTAGARSALAHEEVDAIVDVQLVQICLVSTKVHEQTTKGCENGPENIKVKKDWLCKPVVICYFSRKIMLTFQDHQASRDV